MAEYQLLDFGSVVPHAGAVLRTSDGAHIAADPNDPAYQAYLAWTSAGNTPAPIAPPLATNDTTFAADPWQQTVKETP